MQNTSDLHLEGQIAAHLAAGYENDNLESLKSAKKQKLNTIKKIPKIDMKNKIDRRKSFKITKKAIYL